MKLMTTLAITALVAAGCAQQPLPALSSASDSPSPSISTSTSPSPSASPSASPNASPSTSPNTSPNPSLNAVRIALARTGGGTVDEVEDEVEHGRAAWKVRVVKDGIRYDVYIDKTTGEIFRYENEGRH